VTSGKVWQANQAGSVRTAWIDEFASDLIKFPSRF